MKEYEILQVTIIHDRLNNQEQIPECNGVFNFV